MKTSFRLQQNIALVFLAMIAVVQVSGIASFWPDADLKQTQVSGGPYEALPGKVGTGPIPISSDIRIVQKAKIKFSGLAVDDVYDNFFQTSDSLALRLELNVNRKLYLAADDLIFLIDDNFELGTWHRFELVFEKGVELSVKIDDRPVFSSNEKTVLERPYDFGNIVIGTGFARLRGLQGAIKDFSITADHRPNEISFVVLHIIELIILAGTICLAFWPSRSPARITWGLVVLCAVQLLGLSIYWRYFDKHGYLPSPFIYNKFDTFMDFFNVLYWSNDPGRYSEWGSIYPPINYLFGKLVTSLFVKHIAGADVIRENATRAIITIVLPYLFVPLWAVTTDLWRQFTVLQKALIWAFIVLSPPMLFALERGNFIIFTLGFLVLAISRAGWTRIIALAVLVNIKPYFVILFMVYLVKRDFRQFLSAVLAAGGIFLVTGLLLDSNFLLFFTNLFNFSQNKALFAMQEVLALPSSLGAFTYVLHIEIANYEQYQIFGIDALTIAAAIRLIQWTALAAAFLSLFSIGRRWSDAQILAALTVVISNLSISIGGYSFIWYPFLVPVFMTMRGKWFYIAMVVAIFLPLDAITLATYPLGEQPVFLSGRHLETVWQLGLGSFARPILNFIMMVGLTVEAVSTVQIFNGVRSPLMQWVRKKWPTPEPTSSENS